MPRYARTYRKRPNPGTMNQNEAQYAAHLENLRKAGQIESWAYEPETLRLAHNCKFTPDFRVLRSYVDDPVYGDSTAIVEFHEVKALWKKKGKNGELDKKSVHMESDAAVKLKVVCELHPMYKFILVWKDGNEWMSKEIN